MDNISKIRQHPLQAGFSALTLAAIVAAVPAGVQAQATPSDTFADRERLLEEVVVTARRRSESLSRVPIAVTAISADQITERSIRSDSDLQAAVPGLTIRQTQGNNSLTYSIRGQSADTFSGSPSAVIAYMDEVPLSISGASTFYDLESIQALKGPQGTLFGRNTTGGAVLYTTAKPTDELEGRLRVRAGNLDLREVEGMINIPLVEDTLLLRAAFNTLDRDGYIDNLLTGNDHGKLGRDSGRVSLTFRPNDRLENTSVFSYSRNDSINTGATYVYSVYAPGETNNGHPLNSAAGGLYGPGMDDVFGFEGAWAGYLAAHPEAYAPGLIAYVDEQRRLGHYKTQHLGDARHKGRDWLLTNTTTYDINDNLQLKNIFGASYSETDSDQPPLGAPFLAFVTQDVLTGRSGNESEVDSLSNELQLSGSALDGNLTYIVGLYIQRMEADTLWPQTYFDLSPWAPPSVAINNFRIKTDTDAVYAQGTYSLTPQLRVTAGYRYTREDVTIKQLAEADAFGAASQDETFKEPSWEVGLEYDVSDELFAYLKTRGSFRSGGFNGSAPPIDAGATGGGNKFDAETTEDVEAGLKYLGMVFDRPTSLNLAVYKQWVDDVQRIEFPTTPDAASIAVTANVPKMVVKGVELEASFMPTDWLQLGFAGAYTKARFTDGNVELFGTRYNYSPVANTPKHTGVVWAQIGIPVDPQVGDLRLRSEFYSQSSMYFSNTAASIAPRTKLPGYELVNARLDWSSINGSPFSAAIFGRNLADKKHFVGGMPLGASLGHNGAAVGEPRTYGVEMTYEF
ncbi:MAG: TonB-dependent receptor [Bacteroidales bacterium]|nr:TonB-dependent receptor [Bacteroidales bacterium]